MRKTVGLAILMLGVMAAVTIAVGVHFFSASPTVVLNLPAVVATPPIADSPQISPNVPKPRAAQDQSILAQQLRSDNPDIRQDAIGHIRNLAVSDLKTLSLSLPQWIGPLLDDKQYQDVEKIALAAITARSFDTAMVQAAQRGRVLALMAEGEYPDALKEAKSYYNIASLAGTTEAIDLIEQILNKTADVATASRFKTEQLSGVVQDSILKNIHPNTPSFEEELLALQSRGGSKGYSSTNLIAQGNLLLLLDRGSEAIRCFEATCPHDSNNMRQLRESLDGIARSARAINGNFAPANMLITSLRQDPSGLSNYEIDPPLPPLADIQIGVAQLRLPKIEWAPEPTAADLAFHPSLEHRPPTSTNSAEQDQIASNLKLENDRRFVMSMCIDLQGNLWVGTEGGGVQSFDATAPQGHQWKEYTTKDGLGDDNGYAIACDKQGRIWVGHLNHGVSVFNGQRWQNYEVVGGFSRSDSLSGPIGERIFHIAVCPTDGDVWMASSAGLARYSQSKNNWTYFTRADGLPSDEASSLAFDQDGNIYVATQCDGLAMADAADGYSHWRLATGPNEMVTTPNGEGLPSNLLNDVLVAGGGVVYVATDGGLAWSADRGKNWRFVRGVDWAKKVRRSVVGPPNGWTETRGAVLTEDYCTCLAENSSGTLFVGHRLQGLQRFDLRSGGLVASGLSGGALYVNAIAPGASFAIGGAYGDGVFTIPGVRTGSTTGNSMPAARAISIPAGASPPDLAQMNRKLAEMASVPPLQLKDDAPFIVPLDDDWLTQGDWLGRYGRDWADIGAICGGDYIWGAGDELPFYCFLDMGDPHPANDTIRRWLARLYTDDRRTLEIPPVYMDSRVALGYGTWEKDRRQAEWDDHGEEYPPAEEGPGIAIQLKLPDATFVMSLYQVNDDAQNGSRNRNRDYPIIVADEAEWQLAGTRASALPPSARVVDFNGGVYKRFLVRDPGALRILIKRNGSFNTTLNAIMLDLPNELPAPYFMSVRQQRLGKDKRHQDNQLMLAEWQRNPYTRVEHFKPCSSEEDAVRNLVERLDEMQNWNARWWAINRQRVAVLLARWCQAHSNDVSSFQSLALQASCAYQAGLYSKWESILTAEGESTSRQIEKSLRWNPITPTGSSQGFQFVAEFVAASAAKAKADSLSSSLQSK